MTQSTTPIPDAWRARSPLMTPAAWRGLRDVLQHADAPRWNHTIGDNIDAPAMEVVDAFRERALTGPRREHGQRPSEAMSAWVREQVPRLFHLSAQWTEGLDPAKDWAAVPTCDREDLATRLVDMVPQDAPLHEAVVYTTSGTTGHALEVLHHPRAVGLNHVFGEAALALHGATPSFEEGRPGTINMCAQQRTFVFATSFSVWNHSGFAKLNLAEHDWAGGAASRHRFISEFSPQLITADPLTMAAMMETEAPVRPRAILSSALSLPPAHAAAVSAHFRCPVIDLYGATEVGPIAATVPGVDGHVVLMPDLFVEALDEYGEPVPDGELGELTYTGGRNPYLPLVRYRSSDRGRLGTVALPDGSSARVIRDLEGRAAVRFEDARGRLVNSIDVSRSLREVGAFVQHEVLQRADRSVDIALRPTPGAPVSVERMTEAMQRVFGSGVDVTVRAVEDFGHDGKPMAFRSELHLG